MKRQGPNRLFFQKKAQLGPAKKKKMRNLVHGHVIWDVEFTRQFLFQRAVGDELVDEHNLVRSAAEALFITVADDSDQIAVAHPGQQPDLTPELLVAMHALGIRTLDSDDLSLERPLVNLAKSSLPNLLTFGEVVSTSFHLTDGEAPWPVHLWSPFTVYLGCSP